MSKKPGPTLDGISYVTSDLISDIETDGSYSACLCFLDLQKICSLKVFLNGVKAVDEGGIQCSIFTGGGTWHPLLYLPLSPPPPPPYPPPRGSEEGNCISCNNYAAAGEGGGSDGGDE